MFAKQYVMQHDSIRLSLPTLPRLNCIIFLPSLFLATVPYLT